MLRKFEDLLKLSDKMLDEVLEQYTKSPALFNQEEIFVIEAFLAWAED